MCEDAFRSILVIRMSSIGDILLTTPFLKALGKRFPKAKIDFLTKAQYAELLFHNPALNKIIGFDTKEGFIGLMNLIRELRKARYELVVDLQVNIRSILVRYLIGARLQRRYQKYTVQRQLLKYLRINLLKRVPPVVERYFTALEDFDLEPASDGLEIFFSEKDKEKPHRLFEENGLKGFKILIGIAPGASKPTKRWQAEKFARVGLMLASNRNAGIVILGGKEDEALGDQVSEMIRKESGVKVVNFAGRLNIRESAAMLSHLSVLISNDSALMHLGTAVNIPVVAIFGPTSRELGFFPYGNKAIVVEKEMRCRPCSLHGDEFCPAGHFNCMEKIAPEEVVGACEALLGE